MPYGSRKIGAPPIPHSVQTDLFPGHLTAQLHWIQFLTVPVNLYKSTWTLQYDHPDDCARTGLFACIAFVIWFNTWARSLWCHVSEETSPPAKGHRSGVENFKCHLYPEIDDGIHVYLPGPASLPAVDVYKWFSKPATLDRKGSFHDMHQWQLLSQCSVNLVFFCVDC